MRRGDVVVASAGNGFGRKPRPWIVMQSDDHPSPLVILLGTTTELDQGIRIRPMLTPSPANGLRKICKVMVDVPVTASRQDVEGVIGRLEATELQEVETAFLIILGFGATA